MKAARRSCSITRPSCKTRDFAGRPPGRISGSAAITRRNHSKPRRRRRIATPRRPRPFRKDDIPMRPPLQIVGELMNNSYARARKAFTERNPADYQHLARIQSDLGAAFLTLNLDGTQRIQVRRQDMLDFLPDVVPAIQEATATPLAFDNPSVEYHKIALRHYDRKK